MTVTHPTAPPSTTDQTTVDDADEQPKQAGDGVTAVRLADLISPGGRVEVRTRLDSHRWAKGFEVIDASPEGYRLRRLTDGEEMPVRFAVTDVREEKRRGGNWWY
ncbi:MAG: hypothetical protein JJU45_16080 [Acidimicrobiia bacterium]|nr:hypothetical protein [Acidimicrobiia bacterium]